MKMDFSPSSFAKIYIFQLNILFFLFLFEMLGSGHSSTVTSLACSGVSELITDSLTEKSSHLIYSFENDIPSIFSYFSAVKCFSDSL